MEQGKTLVFGASPNPSRYAYSAVRRLLARGIPPVAVGQRAGNIDGVPILMGYPELDNIHTITLYVGPDRQPPHYDYLLGLRPERIIFNPGTENPEFMRLAREQGIEVVSGCTLVMLAAGTY